MLDHNPYRQFYEFGKCIVDYTESLPDKVAIIVDAISKLSSGGFLFDHHDDYRKTLSNFDASQRGANR